MRASVILLAMPCLFANPAFCETVPEKKPQKVAAKDEDKVIKNATGNPSKTDINSNKKTKAKHPARSSGPKRPFKFKLDGLANDWEGITPLFPEPGDKVDDPGFSVDIIKVYMTNDKDFVYVLMRCTPTVQERFKNNGIGGGFGDLYFDLDNNRETGSTDTDVGAFGYGNGFEMKAFVELGVHDLHGPDEKPIVYHSLKRLHITGGDMGTKKISDLDFGEVPEALEKKRTYEWKDVPGGAQYSHKPNARITFGEDGVEFKIPMKYFNLKEGQTMRVMLAEDAHEYKPEGWTVGPYTAK